MNIKHAHGQGLAQTLTKILTGVMCLLQISGRSLREPVMGGAFLLAGSQRKAPSHATRRLRPLIWRRHGIMLFCVAYFGVVALAHAADLLEVYHKALLNDPEYQTARAAYLAATEAYPQARALLLPNIQFNANYTENDITNKSSGPQEVTGALIGIGRFETTNYTLNITQPIINFNAFSQLHLAKYTVKQAAAVFVAATQDLMLRVSQAYFEVLEAIDNLRFSKAENRANKRQLDQSQQRFKVGLDAITSVYDAQAAYDATTAQVIAAKNAVVNARERLRQITGVYYKKLASLKTNYPLVRPHPDDVEAWVTAAERQNFDLIAARFAAHAAKENIQVNFANNFPVVNFVGVASQDTASKRALVGLNRITVTGALQLSVPVFVGGAIASQTHQAQYEYQQAVAEEETTYREVTVSVRTTYNDIIAGISKIKADKETIKSRRASVESTEAALKVGTRTIVDLLIAQRELFDSQRVLATDTYAYINDQLNLRALDGTLSANDLAKVNRWLTTSRKMQAEQAKYYGMTQNDATTGTEYKDLATENAIEATEKEAEKALDESTKKTKTQVTTKLPSGASNSHDTDIDVFDDENENGNAKKAADKNKNHKKGHSEKGQHKKATSKEKDKPKPHDENKTPAKKVQDLVKDHGKDLHKHTRAKIKTPKAKPSKAKHSKVSTTHHRKSDFYAIQIASSPNKKVIEHVIKKYKLQHTAFIQQTKIKQQRWYRLLYGHYSSLDNAVAALKKLPHDLAERKPWVRRVAL